MKLFFLHYIIVGASIARPNILCEVIKLGKALFIAEKPSVAKEFAKILKITGRQADGYIEGENAIATWCVGHLVNMSYPEKYDEN